MVHNIPLQFFHISFPILYNLCFIYYPVDSFPNEAFLRTNLASVDFVFIKANLNCCKFRYRVLISLAEPRSTFR